VELHASGYKERQQGFCGCHGLAPWSFTLAATRNVSKGFADATALRRGASRFVLKIERDRKSVKRETPVRQAKLGVSGGVKVPVE